MSINVKEWKKKDRHRLYFSTPAGEDLGWFDLAGQHGKLFNPHYASEYVAEIVTRGGRRAAALHAVKEATLAQKKVVDLSRNRAGAAALAQGKRIQRSGAPVAEVQKWVLGARGEMKMGEYLDSLPSDKWKVLHSVPVGIEGSDIDHLVIGVGGVFTINTKTHPRSRVVCEENKVTVTKGGWHKQMPYARNSRFEAKRVRGILKKVTGVDAPTLGVVAYFAGEVVVVAPPKDGKVRNLGAGSLVDFLLAQPVVLSVEQVGRLWEAARWGGVWDGSGVKRTEQRTMKK